MCIRDRHRGVHFLHRAVPKPAKDTAWLGFPYNGLPTASGSTLPTSHRAEVGERRFAPAANAQHAVHSIGEYTFYIAPRRSRRKTLRVRASPITDCQQHRGEMCIRDRRPPDHGQAGLPRLSRPTASRGFACITASRGIEAVASNVAPHQSR